jgi:anaerobic selenocysteine-containing dehydrogenase
VRPLGVPTFGFSPFPALSTDTMHIGRPNERVDLPSFLAGIALGSAVAGRFAVLAISLLGIVSFSPFMDESTMNSDLVLPDGTYFERWQDDHAEPGLGFPMFGLRTPAIQPLLYDVRNSGDVLIEIANRLGGNVARSFPWKDFQEALREAVQGVFRSRRGSIKAEDFDEFWNALIERGGWWDPLYPFGQWKKRFDTPSGKFEFFALRLEQGLRQRRFKWTGQGLQRIEDRSQWRHCLSSSF